ncbi:MAG: NADH-quinone oxidoreductase subunit C [Bacteroidota bacterium]
MDYEELKTLISKAVTEPEYEEEGSEYLVVNISPENWKEAATNLKAHAETSFDYLFCLTGVDWGKELGVVYHLKSSTLGHSIEVKVKTEDREDPRFPTVSDIWRTAEFHEREVYDLYGITFENHPDLRRIFLEDDWVGFPLRKDYVDDINIVQR